jgi:peptidyl-prolyl cis-trans isomerase SurA
MKSLVVLALAYGTGIGQVLDRVVAVVSDELILESELNAQIQFFVLNNKVDPATPGLREQVLQSMVNEKLIVAKAIEDSVAVTDEEVQERLNSVIQQRIQQVGSEERLEELYGMPLTRIRREFRDEMRQNLLASKLQQQRFGSTRITRREVEEFFQQFKDSIGQVPEEVELAHIFIRPRASDDARRTARATMQMLLDSLRAGMDFGELARRHSEDPGSAPLGGDLSWVRRGQFVKNFETAVFALEEGSTSDIIETEFGFHLIQLLERRGDAVHPRHILVRVPRTEADNDSTIALLNRLRSRALAGESFAGLAKEYSEEKETATVGGSLGTSELEQLDKNFYPTVAPLKQADISMPTRLADGFHIVLMKNRIPGHPPTLEHDYRRLEAVALNYKQSRDYAAWLEELRGNIHWEIRP